MVPPKSSWFMGAIVGALIPFFAEYLLTFSALTYAGTFVLNISTNDILYADQFYVPPTRISAKQFFVSSIVDIPFYGLLIGTIITKLSGRKIERALLIPIVIIITFLVCMGLLAYLIN